MGLFKRIKEYQEKKKQIIEEERIRLKNEQIEKEKNLLQLQKIVLQDSPDELIMSESSLLQAAQLQVQNDLRILHESSNICNNTLNPEVFFSRLDLCIEKINHLILFEPFFPFSDEMLPSKAAIVYEAELQNTLHEFLEKYYTSTYENAQKLKTESGRKKRLQKYYDNLQPYFSRLNEDNLEFVKSKMTTEVSGGIYDQRTR